MTHEEKLDYLISHLLREDPGYQKIEIPTEDIKKRRLLRTLMNIRTPLPLCEEFLAIQDLWLQEELANKTLTDVQSLSPVPLHPKLYLWQGDITTLKVDGIVNAANSKMLGCFVPCHACIDNVIHSAAGIQLRLACHELIVRQGYDEPTGTAKITSGYNLPSQYILHTVGPIINGPLKQKDCELLVKCYRSCLSAASEHKLKSIAFCCISTGEFHFPRQKAAEIAVETVLEYLKNDQHIEKVIINVFQQEDYEIYKQLLG